MSPSEKTRPSQELANLPDDHVLALSLERPEAFSELVDRYQRPFMRKAISILGNKDEAYDAVQEAFVRIYTSARKFKKQPNASFRSWSYAILVNRCYTLYRKRQKHVLISIDDGPSQEIPDLQAIAIQERSFDREYVLSLVSRLPELLRRVVTMHFLEGKPQREIAQHEGITPEAVRVRIHRAKKELSAIHIQDESLYIHE